MKARLRPRDEGEVILLAKLHRIAEAKGYFDRIAEATKNAAIAADGEDLIREHGALRLIEGVREQMRVCHDKLEKRRRGHG